MRLRRRRFFILLLNLANASESDLGILRSSPEAVVHDFFRNNKNHFPELEHAAAGFWDGKQVRSDDVYAALKERLRTKLGVKAELVSVAKMPDTLREYDEVNKELRLSEGLDHPNRTFQLVHMTALIEHSDLIDTILARLNLNEASGLNRCRVELATYFAAAV